MYARVSQAAGDTDQGQGALICIPTYNEAENLPLIVAAVREQAPPAHILVVEHVVDRFVAAHAMFSAAEREALTRSLSDGGVAEGMRTWFEFLDAGGSRGSAVEQMMGVDMRANLADDLLLNGDKLSMMSSLEARVPTLDLELVAFVESLPLSMKTSLRRTKIVHKATAETYLPASIVHRKKRGFQVPFTDWSRGIWRPYLESVLFDDGAAVGELIDRREPRRMWDAHQRDPRDLGRQFSALTCLALTCDPGKIIRRG